MALQEIYTSAALASLLAITRQGVDWKAKTEHWQFRPRKGRGGGKEWLLASMPQATQEAIRRAEERKAIEQETAKNAVLPDVLASGGMLQAETRHAILDDKRRYKALAKADL